MSKFTYLNFYGDSTDKLAVSKEKYSKEEAIKIAKHELSYELTDSNYLYIGDAFVRHRAGINDNNEPCVGWWLEYNEYNRSCPVYVFHVSQSEDDRQNIGYELIT